MTKFYRTRCFQEIGGFVRQVMWDGIDNHRCRMLGWKAASWDEPALRFEHLRPMGSSHKGILTGRMRHGYGQYFMGTGPVYMLASAVVRMAKPPYVVGGAAMMWGYVKAAVDGRERLNDPAFRAFLRRWQRDALLRGKRAATRSLDDTWRERARPDGYRPEGSEVAEPRDQRAETTMGKKRTGAGTAGPAPAAVVVVDFGPVPVHVACRSPKRSTSSRGGPRAAKGGLC